MTNETLWIIGKLKQTSFKNIFIKSFYQTKNGKVWDDDDLKDAVDPIPKAFVGVSNWKDCADRFLFARSSPDARGTFFEVDFQFKHAGQLSIPLETLKEDVFNDFCKTLFIQLMMLAEKGYSIQLGRYGDTLVEPHSEIEALIACDLMAW